MVDAWTSTTSGQTANQLNDCVRLPATTLLAMGYARKSLVCLNDTPYYHVVARCVRRAWLWGYDEYAGRDYSHRKNWVLERLRSLCSVFAIDVCAYAVMSNHYHLVLHVDQRRALAFSRQEVAERWSCLFTLPATVKRWQQGSADEAETACVEHLIDRWRRRLIDVSWFMRCLNEYLARRANAEDGCTGRFWEGRFRSQALLDEAGLLTAMAYVDLNPVRAGIAATPEDSEYTSIYARIEQLRRPSSSPRPASSTNTRVPLLPFCGGVAADHPAIPMSFCDYLQLVDWSGRIVRKDKRSAIDQDIPPILTRLNIDPNVWRQATRARGYVFGRALGRLDHLRLHARALGQSWIKGQGQAQRLYRSA